MEQTKGLFCTGDSGVARCQSHHNVSLLANEIDVRSILHGQMSLAEAYQICVIHEAINGCKKSKDSLKACFDNVNIPVYIV